MKGIVSKALSNCGRVAQPKLHTTTRLSMASQPRVLKSTSAATKPVAVKLASPKVTAAPKFVEYKSNIINAKSLSEVNVESLPQEITWLSGAPGAGKGTNSKFVSEICGYTAPTIVVSSLLEQPEFKRIKDAGGIVDDESVFKVLSKELSKPQYKNGVVVDGFPRTQQQAEWLASLHQRLSANKKSLRFNFVMLYVNEETSIARQLARGAAIRAQNSILRSSGGILLEERATDVCSKAAKVRYTGFIEKHEAISQTLEAHQFPCYVVDASSTVEAVRDNLYSCLNNNNKLNNTLLNNTFLNQTKQQQFVVSSLYSSAMDSHMQASSSSSGPNRLMFA